MAFKERSENADAPELDPDERYFAANPNMGERLRPALEDEWPQDSHLLTAPPFTLVIKVHPGLLLKLGAWRSTANSQGSVVLLKQGRMSISSYLEHLRRGEA